MNERPILAVGAPTGLAEWLDRPTVAASSLETVVEQLERRRPAVVVCGADGPPSATLVAAVRENTDAVVTTELPETATVRGGEALSVVIEELLDNAIEHNDAAETDIEVAVTVSRDHVDVSVWDNGSGLPPEERAMFRGETEPTQLEHASGLGLWMVKWVVEAVGGRLAVDTATDGTEVGFRLPRTHTTEEEVLATEQDAA